MSRCAVAMLLRCCGADVRSGIGPDRSGSTWISSLVAAIAAGGSQRSCLDDDAPLINERPRGFRPRLSRSCTTEMLHPAQVMGSAMRDELRAGECSSYLRPR